MDGLTALLSRLPPELRLYIYRLSLPCTRHRKYRARLDYIGDCRWMATSQAIFLDAGPTVFSGSMLYFHSNLQPHENIMTYFDDKIIHAFQEDSAWVLPLARSMVGRIAVTIRWWQFYRDNNDPSQYFVSYFSTLHAFPGLKEVHISYGAEQLPQSRSVFREHAAHFCLDYERLTTDANLLESPVIPAFKSIRAQLPKGCVVKWRFDRAAMPGWSRRVYTGGVDEVVTHFDDVNRCMARLWELSGTC